MTGRQPPGWPRLTPRAVWIGRALVLGALALRLLHYPGILASDPISYIGYAHALATGTYEFELHHYATRYAVWAPVAALRPLLGSWERAALVWPLLCSLTTVWLTFRIGVLQRGLVAGLVAGCLLVTLPVDIGLGTATLPEPVLAAGMTGAAYAFLRAERTDRAGWLVLAGFLVWFAWSAKMLGALLLPVMLVVLLTRAGSWTRPALLLAGFSAPFAIELGTYLATTGDPLFRIAAASGGPHAESPMVAMAARDLAARFFVAYPSHLLLRHGAFGITALFVVPGVLYGLWRIRDYPLLTGWALATALVLNFGVTNLDPVTPLPTAPRYLLPALVPVFVLAGCLGAELWSRAERGRASWRWLAIGSAALLGLTVVLSLCFAQVSVGRSYIALTGGEMDRVAAAIESGDPPHVVFADDRSRRSLRVELGYPSTPELRAIPSGEGECEPAAPWDELEGEALLVVNWREVRKEGPYALYRCGERETVEAVAARTSPAFRVRSGTGPLFDALTDLALFRAAVPSDAREELLERSGPRRGTWVYRVGPYDPIGSKRKPRSSSSRKTEPSGTSAQSSALIRSEATSAER